MEISQSWNEWKKTLGTAMGIGKSLGISEDSMGKIAYRIGDFLAGKIDPANREQKLIAELWAVADEHEQEAFAKMIVKLISKDQVKH